MPATQINYHYYEIMIETPFEIGSAPGGILVAGNGKVTVSSEFPCYMRKRRGFSMGGSAAEMLYVQLKDGPRVYVRQFADGSVAVQITDREIYF